MQNIGYAQFEYDPVESDEVDRNDQVFTRSKWC